MGSTKVFVLTCCLIQEPAAGIYSATSGADYAASCIREVEISRSVYRYTAGCHPRRIRRRLNAFTLLQILEDRTTIIRDIKVTRRVHRHTPYSAEVKA